MPAASALSEATLQPDRAAEVADERRHGQRGEEAVDDGRHAGQDLQDRLGRGAELVGRVLGEVDRGQQAERHRDRHRDHGDQQRAGEQRHRAEAAGRGDLIGADRGLRAPLEAEQELADRHLLEEADRFEQQREDDPGGGQDRDRSRQQQRRRDPALDPVAGAKARLDPAEPDRHCRDGERQRADHEGDRADAVEPAPEVGRGPHRIVGLGIRRQSGRHPAHVVEEEVEHRRRCRVVRRQPALDDPAQHEVAEQQPAEPQGQRRAGAQQCHVPGVVAGLGVQAGDLAPALVQSPPPAEIEAGAGEQQDQQRRGHQRGSVAMRSKRGTGADRPRPRASGATS